MGVDLKITWMTNKNIVWLKKFKAFFLKCWDDNILDRPESWDHKTI